MLCVVPDGGWKTSVRQIRPEVCASTGHKEVKLPTSFSTWTQLLIGQTQELFKVLLQYLPVLQLYEVLIKAEMTSPDQ